MQWDQFPNPPVFGLLRIVGSRLTPIAGGDSRPRIPLKPQNFFWINLIATALIASYWTVGILYLQCIYIIDLYIIYTHQNKFVTYFVIYINYKLQML